ncbi:MAG: AAA family ATPase [Pseudomonadota bacterium]
MTIPPQLSLLKGSSLSSLELPPRKLLLGEWLTERHPCMVYAQTGRGKSLFAMSVAIAVAGGGTVFGWTATEPRKVLYIDGEMDVADMQERDALLIPAVEDVDSEALEENRVMLSRHYQSHGVVFPDLVENGGRAALLELVDELEPALVVLDNLSCLADIKDENDAASFTPVLSMLWQLRKKGCAVLLLHHTGKQEGKFRGSSKLAANFESILQLAPNDELLVGDTGFTLKVDKSRSGRQPDPLRIKLEVDSDTGGGQWIFGEATNRHLEEVVRLVRSRDFCLAKDLAAHLGMSSPTLSKHKRKAIASGLITGAEWDLCFQEARDTEREFEDDCSLYGLDAEEDDAA